MRPSGRIDADLAGGFGHDLVTLTELQFRQVEAALTAVSTMMEKMKEQDSK